MDKPVYFVPVDFSPGSYKAVEYAMMLIQLSGGRVVLFHVIDPGQIAESDNPIVVHRSINRLTASANDKLESISEIILESGLEASCELTFGKPRVEISKFCKTNIVHFVVMSQKQMTSIFGRRGGADIKSPLFIVPETAPMKRPHNVLLATDLKPIKADGFSRFLKLIHKTCEELMLLYVTKKPVYNGREVAIRQRMAEVGKLININTTFSYQQHGNVASGILDFSMDNDIDLLCTIKRKNGISRYLSKSISNELANESDLPMLVLNECE
jgi:nucleotide-binding universal stress UspA family protein